MVTLKCFMLNYNINLHESVLKIMQFAQVNPVFINFHNLLVLMTKWSKHVRCATSAVPRI